MTRLSYVEPAAMSAEQKELYDSIARGPRAAKRKSLVDADGHLTGPFNAFLHLPALGKSWSEIGEALRFRTTIERRLFELAILVVAVHWQSGHEWAAHARLAREAGIGEEVVAALKDGARPVFEKPDEDAVFRFVSELVTQRHASDASYKAAVSILGETQLVELVNAVGYYVALAAMLNAFDVHPPAGLEDPWPRRDGA
ncbi:MAG TPA: carboxymuconolactone decarboxylase family protein [Micropepsaceae bacterium]|jgi:4-carboxymuconolactone decarboxylase|nr:carboxymuconolactone decarboxylase family protein [Micropepsaceae bacterium]